LHAERSDAELARLGNALESARSERTGCARSATRSCQEEEMSGLDYDEFFRLATGSQPFEWQRRFATSETVPSMVSVPTGLGKTAGAILGWLWRRRFADEATRRATPRRLIYCLPMRVLVEQTRDCSLLWLNRLDLIGGSVDTEGVGSTESATAYRPSWNDPDRIAVSTLLGGEDDGGWDLYPERDAILVGTQDMLLSRALNRGYGMSRYRWPMHFGLLNDDSLWVVDEVQLLGAGLATTAQLQAFRRLLGTHHPVQTVWMSATMAPEWLDTVDVDLDRDATGTLGLTSEDMKSSEVSRRVGAGKPLRAASARMGESQALAAEILAVHRPGTRTLVVVNTVKRAVDLHGALTKRKPAASLVLVHSRFRPPERAAVVQRLLEPPSECGTIVVSTQVVEAGVDLSSTTLFTELAPWASLVQRFGRCNRAGRDADAAVFWIDLSADEKRATTEAAPYEFDDLREAHGILARAADVGPSGLPSVTLPFRHGQVVRRRDLIELFDTTPDLAGYDVDVSGFIRETDDRDVQVFWRDVPETGPAPDEPQPHRDELCSAPLPDIRVLANDRALMWRWDPLGEEWERVTSGRRVYPGLVLMLPSADRRYTSTEGWNPKPGRKGSPVDVLPRPARATDDRYGGDPASERKPLTLVEHTERVVAEAGVLVDACRLDDPWRAAVDEAARWHDAGKAHPVFQRAMYGDGWSEGLALRAKSESRRRYRRKVDGKLVQVPFRHELASAFLALQHGRDDLVAYLAAAHHGKVRLSIRSLPDEAKPRDPGLRFARGVWEGDAVPDVDLGRGVSVPATILDLSYMELGETPERGASWLARALALRDRPDLGPFRLGLLEALMKAADERASQEA